MKKRRRIKKGPVLILILIIVGIIFGIFKLFDKPRIKEENQQNNNDIVEENQVEEKKSPLEMSLEEFTLEGYFEGTILTEKAVNDEFMSNIIYAGDSIALYYTINKINRLAVWHQISINPLTAQTCSVYVNSVKEYDSFVQLFEEKKPEIVIMTMGTNGVAAMNKDYFIEQYEIFLKSLMEVSPNTTLIVQSIPPVPIERDLDGKALNNQKINEYNYYIAQMCERLGLKFLFSANSMKDETGGCKDGYCTTDLHPSKAGNDALYEYSKNHLGSL